MKKCNPDLASSTQFLRLECPFSVRPWPFVCSQTHSGLQPLQQPAPRRPQIAQGKQLVQLLRVLSQPPVTHFHVSDLPLDDSERMFHFGSEAGLDVFKLVEHSAHGSVLVQRAALARAHGHMRVGFDALKVFAFGFALISSIGEHICFSPWTNPELASTPLCDFMPKCHWLPVFVWCISGSRSPSWSLVDLGAAIRMALTTASICDANWCSSSKFRKCRMLSLSGVRSMLERPANSRYIVISNSAYSMTRSLRPIHCCKK